MAQEPERVQVTFLGETFTVKGDAREDIRKASGYLQEQLDIMKNRFPRLAAKNIALLTAFNLADELIRVRKDYEALISILDKS